MPDMRKFLEEKKVDPNNQQLFFSILIKAIMRDLFDLIKIRGQRVPHMIMNTGDDIMYLLEKEHDSSIEPLEISNEQYIYNVVPRCVVSLGGLDTMPDQLSNPYTRGQFQVEVENMLYTLSGEFRRMPLKIAVTLKYLTESFTDTLELMQYIVTKLCYVRTFKFVYLGQTMIASYRIPEAFSDEHMMEITGDTKEARNHTTELALEVETNMPVFAEGSINEIKVVKRVSPPNIGLVETPEPSEDDWKDSVGSGGNRPDVPTLPGFSASRPKPNDPNNPNNPNDPSQGEPEIGSNGWDSTDDAKSAIQKTLENNLLKSSGVYR